MENPHFEEIWEYHHDFVVFCHCQVKTLEEQSRTSVVVNSEQVG